MCILQKEEHYIKSNKQSTNLAGFLQQIALKGDRFFLGTTT